MGRSSWTTIQEVIHTATHRPACGLTENDAHTDVSPAHTGSTLPVIVAEDPLTCVARGGGRALEMMDKHTMDLLSSE